MPQKYSATSAFTLLVVLACCTGTHRPQGKERDAVRLLGMAAAGPLGGVDIEMVLDCPMSGYGASAWSEENTRRAAAGKILDDWVRPDEAREFRGPNIGDSLHATARKLASLAKACSKMYASIPTAGYPDTAEVVAILGTADSSRDTVLVDKITGDSIPTSYHHYGWLEFRAVRGKVASLSVDIKASGY